MKLLSLFLKKVHKIFLFFKIVINNITLFFYFLLVFFNLF